MSLGPWSLYVAKSLNRTNCFFNGCTNFTNLQYFNYRIVNNELQANAPMADGSRSLSRTVTDITYEQTIGKERECECTV